MAKNLPNVDIFNTSVIYKHEHSILQINTFSNISVFRFCFCLQDYIFNYKVMEKYCISVVDQIAAIKKKS